MVLRSRDGASRRRLLLLNALLVASALVTAAVAVRVVLTQSDGTSGLVWNLFLAWIPFLLALGVYDAARRRRVGVDARRPRGALAPLPPERAVHRHRLQVAARTWSATYWFDPLTIGAAAALGLVLGFVSVYLVQAVAAQRLGRLVGWGSRSARSSSAARASTSGASSAGTRGRRSRSRRRSSAGSRGASSTRSRTPSRSRSRRSSPSRAAAATPLFYSLFRPHLHRLEDR